MSTGEDEPLSGLNGRLRPRKSTTQSPQNKTIRKAESKQAQDRPKRTSTPSKASPSKQNDLSTKSDTLPPLFLCPYCDRKFNVRQAASKHARRIHLSTSKQDNFIKCLYCNHSDAESNAIIKHMVDCHPNHYFACLDCQTRFSSTTALAEHKLNVCEKQKPAYRSKLRQKTLPRTKNNSKRSKIDSKSDGQNENTRFTDEPGFNGIVISCELKPSAIHDATDVEDKITTNLILPPSKTLGSSGMEKNAVIVLDDLQWNKRIPPNFSFHNTDADQILSRLGVVHRSPRVGESRKDLIRLMDEPNEKFEKCFDTNFYSKVSKNVQENLAKYLDGSFNFNPDKETIKTRKSKASVVINTAEGFPILLAYEQFSRHLFDGLMPRTIAPKHKWKWDTADSDNKNALMLLDHTKRDSHVNNCIITLVSSLDIWTQLRMRRKFEEIFKTTPTAKKTEKQNIISMELKEILESRDIPTSYSPIVKYHGNPTAVSEGSELPSYLGLSPNRATCEMQPAVLSGEWVRPRAYVCCACGEQTRDGRTLSTHITSRHPNAQVQHYEIVGETLLSADILKHLYVPPSQISNRTRPPRGFRDCTKCKKSITLEDLHQHMLDCAGDTPAVRRKCRYRPFGVRRRRPRLPDNTIRKKMRKEIRSRHRQKVHMRPRPRIRTEVGDAETIRKMIADLPAKRNRITPSNVLRPRRNILKSKKAVKLRSSVENKSNKARTSNKLKKTEIIKKHNDNDNSSTIDEDDQPLKLSAKRASARVTSVGKEPSTNKKKETKKKKQSNKKDSNMKAFYPSIYNNFGNDCINPHFSHPNMINSMIPGNILPSPIFNISQPAVLRPQALHPNMFPPFSPPYVYHQTQIAIEHENYNERVGLYLREEQTHLEREQECETQLSLEQSSERIDVFSAGPSNVKQHGNRDDCNMQSGKNRPGGRDDGSQNNNLAPVPNTPLRHSIASLTSDTELRDGSAVYRHTHSRPVENNVTIAHESSDNRREFENYAAETILDKPPLPIDPGNSPEPSRPPSRYDLVKYRESGGQPPLPNHLIALPEPGEQPPLPNDPIESAVPENDHKCIEVKMETEKSKLNKSRKGLNDCIAMLITKKGLRLDKCVSDKNADDETQGSDTTEIEIANTKSMSAEVEDTKKLTNQTTSVSLSDEYKTRSEAESLRDNDVVNSKSAQVLSPSSLPVQTLNRNSSENNTQQKSIERLILGLQTDNPFLQPQSQNRDVTPENALQILRRNSFDGLSISPRDPESSRMADIMSHSVNPVCNMRDLNFSNTSLATRAELLGCYVQEVASNNNNNQQITTAVTRPPTVSPTSRRTRRKPAKKSELEQQPAFNYRRSTPQVQESQSSMAHIEPEDQTEVPTDDIKKTTTSSEGSNINLSLPVGLSCSLEILPLKTLSPQVEKEPYIRVLENTPTDNHTENTMNAQGLRHHSTEMITAQSNERLMTGTYVDISEISSSTRDLSNLHVQAPEDLTKRPNIENNRNDTPHENISSYSPSSTFVTINQDTHGVMHVNTEVNRKDNVKSAILSPEIQDFRKTPVENEQQSIHVQTMYEKQSLNRKSESIVDYSVIRGNEPIESTYTNQDCAANMQTSNALNNNVHRYGIQSSEEYYRRMSSYQNNSLNMNALDGTQYSLMYDENRHNNSLHAYHTPYNTSFAVPAVTYSNSIYGTIPLMSALPCEPGIEETPLDLSCDPRARNTIIPDSLLNLSHGFKKPNEILIIDDNDSEPPFAVDLCKHIDQSKSCKSSENKCNEKIVNLGSLDKNSKNINDVLVQTSRNLMYPVAGSESVYEIDNEDIYFQHSKAPNLTMNSSDSFDDISKHNRLDMIHNEENIQQPVLTTSAVHPMNRLLDSEKSLYKNSNVVSCVDETGRKLKESSQTSTRSLDQCVSQPLSCNYLTTRQIHSSSVNSNHQDEELEMTFLQNKKILRAAPKHVSHIVSESNYENKTLTQNNTTVTISASDTGNPNVKNIDSHKSGVRHMTDLELSTSAKSTSELNYSENQATSLRTVSDMYKTDLTEKNNQSPDQDQETAQKIAMIPKEIIDIINRIPEDTRNKLINVLPQYVTTPIPVSIAGKDVINTPAAADEKKNEIIFYNENMQRTKCLDSTRLSVNTAISPSSIIPKKRHSPSQSSGCLNYNEAQSPSSIQHPSHMQTLSQLSPILHKANLPNIGQCPQIDQENSVNNPFTLMRQKSFDKDSDETEINVVDLSEPETMSKNSEISRLARKDFFPPTTAQDLALNNKPKTKNSNEQTASLRAVRIRTPLARKSFSDEKRISLSSQTYTTSNAKYANLSLVNDPVTYKGKAFYDKTETNEEADNDDSMRVSKSQNVCVEVNQKVQEKSMVFGYSSAHDTLKNANEDLAKETNAESNKNFHLSDTTMVISTGHSPVLEVNQVLYENNVNDSSSSSTHVVNNIHKDTCTRIPTSLAFFSDKRNINHEMQQNMKHSVEIINDNEHNLLGPPKTTPVLGVDGKSVALEHIISESTISINKTKEESLNIISPQSRAIENDYETERKSLSCFEHTENLSKIYKEKESEFSQSPNLNVVKETPYNSLGCSLEKVIVNTKTSPSPLVSNDTGVTEDDSDDDICLAVIKQKQYSQPCVTSKADSTIPEISATKDTLTAKLNTKEKEVRNFKRKKNTKSLQICENNKLTGFMNDTSEIYLNLNDKEVKEDESDSIAKTVNTVIGSDQVKIGGKFDINKENNISESVNNYKQSESSNLLEDIQVEIQSDNSISKHLSNELTDRSYRNLDENINKVQFEEKEIIPADSDITSMTDLHDLKVNNKFSSTKRNQQKSNKKNKTQKFLKIGDDDHVNNYSDVNCINSDIESNYELNMSSLNEIITDTPISNPIDSVHEESQECTKNPGSTTTPDDRFKRDFRLCSEIRDTNTLPLRRSRRGKSMYVDIRHADDSEHSRMNIQQVEELDQKMPLTMKQLILSRVEKDKKLVNEDIFEKCSDDPDDFLDFRDRGNNEPNVPLVNKTKVLKRKKSPHSRQKSKKTKSLHKQQEGNKSVVSNLLDNSNSIPQDLPYAENDIVYKETPRENTLSHSTTDGTIISANLTFVGKESILVYKGEDDLMNLKVKETNVSGKRKLCLSKISDLTTSKSKKTKYHKKNASSDFDSDDEKGLLETKQKMGIEKRLISDKETSNNYNIPDKNEYPHNKTSENNNAVNTDVPKHITNASAPVETRTTCYSKPSSNRRPRSFSASLKECVNYDPYDIDFEDMVETTLPIVKKKGKNTVKSRLDIRPNTKSDDTNMSTSDNPSLKYDTYKTMALNVSNEYDSDSSKSDVPLQKYVDEKICKNMNAMDYSKILDANSSKHITEYFEPTFESSKNSVQKEENSKDDNSHDEFITNDKNSTGLANSDSVCDNEAVNTDLNSNTNQFSIDESTQKPHTKQKKPRRTLAAYNNVDSISATDEVDQQLRSDKFMENFGFYSERIPRKSNLLASKKISETFHMISNESDDSYFSYKEKISKKSSLNENKKKSETGSDLSESQDSRPKTTDATNINIQSAVIKMDITENSTVNKPHEVTGTNDSEMESLTVQNMESETARDLENALKEAEDTNSSQNNLTNYQYTSILETNPQHASPKTSFLNSEGDIQKQDECSELIKKTHKIKPNKPSGYKEKMYPDVEEIDMFEDKFDKIKRKRRSQAVAAKQFQNTVDTSNSVKSRKPNEKKKAIKATKKTNSQNNQVQVPTKGALKGFEGIKISIPTQDLNMPPNVSPPRLQKKRKKVTTKRRKETTDSESSYNEFDEKDKSVLEKDIYEFKDSEDTELFELRPSTVMDRFRSMHNKKKIKHKEKGKGDAEKEKQRDRAKERDRKSEPKEKVLESEGKHQEHEYERRQKKHILREEKRSMGKLNQNDLSDVQESIKFKDKCSSIQENANVSSNSKTLDQYPAIKHINVEKYSALETHPMDNHSKEDGYSAIASTSGFVPDRIDESDYESELSSPEGEFIFYMSDDINCVCPSDNDSDESDVERGCGRPNCNYKNTNTENADKNAAIGNIFKNNAVRCEKPETKEPEEPRPDLDQLFDSLFETKPASREPNNDLPINQNKVNAEHIERYFVTDLSAKDDVEENIRKSKDFDQQIELRPENSPITLDINTNLKESGTLASKQDQETLSKPSMKYNDTSTAKWGDRLSLSIKDSKSGSGSSKIFAIGDSVANKLELSKVTKDDGHVYNEVVQETESINETNVKNPTNEVGFLKTSKNRPSVSERDFDRDKREQLNKQYTYSKLHDEKRPSIQTEQDSHDFEPINELPVAKYLRGLTPSETAQCEILSQTGILEQKIHSIPKPVEYTYPKHNQEKEMQAIPIPKGRIRLQRYEVHGKAQKSISTKSLQTDINKSSKIAKYNDVHAESDDDDLIVNKCDDRLPNKTGSIDVLDKVKDVSPSQEIDSFATPTSRHTEKYSPRKSDEGISTSHDYSADALDQTLFDDSGVARQRARRKCTVGKQNILAEHWSSESEFDGVPPRPNSADSVVASASRKKKSRKKDHHHSGGKRGNRHASKNESKVREHVSGEGGLSEDSDAFAPVVSRAPPGPKMRARPAHHYWSSDGEDAAGPQPQHGWIVGDSHKKLVTMLAHAKGRKRASVDKRHHFD